MMISIMKKNNQSTIKRPVFKTVSLMFFSTLLFINAATANQTLSTELQQGISAFNAGNYPQALDIFKSETRQAAKQKAPTNEAIALQWLGKSQYAVQNSKSAVTSLEKSIELNPQDSDSHYALGVSYLARTGSVGILKVRKMLKKSIAHFEKAIELNPNHNNAHFYLIQLLINAPGIMGGDEEEGLKLNQKLSTLSPLQHLIVNSTLAMKEEDFQKAEVILLDADKQFPNTAMVAYSLGELALRNEKFSEALSYGESFLAGKKQWDESNDNSGYYLVARAYKGLNQKADSQRYFNKVLNNTNSKRMKKQIQKELDELDGKIVPEEDDELENIDMEALSQEAAND